MRSADEPTMYATDNTNPKDAMASTKRHILSVVPAISLEAEAAVMAYGAYKAPRKDGGVGYGPFNWRDTPVRLSVYVDAMQRHMLDYINGEECAPDSKEHHLAHLKANCGIILDAMKHGTLIDDLRRKPKVESQARDHRDGDDGFLAAHCHHSRGFERAGGY